MNINQARQTSHDSPKGQEILEDFLCCLQFLQKKERVFFSTSTRASIKWSNQKKNYVKVPILKEVNFGKMQLCRVEHLLNTFSTYLSSKLDSSLCIQNIGEGESNIDDKYVEKVFNKCSTRQLVL